MRNPLTEAPRCLSVRRSQSTEGAHAAASVDRNARLAWRRPAGYVGTHGARTTRLFPPRYDQSQGRSIIDVEIGTACVAREGWQELADPLLALSTRPDCATFRRRKRGCVCSLEVGATRAAGTAVARRPAASASLTTGASFLGALMVHASARRGSDTCDVAGDSPRRHRIRHRHAGLFAAASRAPRAVAVGAAVAADAARPRAAAGSRSGGTSCSASGATRASGVTTSRATRSGHPAGTSFSAATRAAFRAARDTPTAERGTDAASGIATEHSVGASGGAATYATGILAGVGQTRLAPHTRSTAASAPCASGAAAGPTQRRAAPKDHSQRQSCEGQRNMWPYRR
jgi:hypothetical protein